MVRLNRKLEYAFVALKYISGKYSGQVTTVKEICAATKVPFDATSRVMQLMAQKQILKAEHGLHGGYFLVKSLSRLTLLEVLEAVSGPVEVVRCVSTNKECDLLAQCNVVSPLHSFNERLTEFYRELTMAELLQIRESVS